MLLLFLSSFLSIFHRYVTMVMQGRLEPRKRTRMETRVESDFTMTRLPPALNDILIAHPNPASVSRYVVW